MNRRLLLSAMVLAVAVAAAAQGYSRKGNCVTVETIGKDGVKAVRLQVINPDIIRVEATANDAFPQKQSLVVVEQPMFSDFKVVEEGGLVKVLTANVTASVDRQTARVEFRDLDGNVLLSGSDHNMKMTPFTVPERELGQTSKLSATSPELQAMRHGYSYNLVFNSPEDEAFYGLGHHQTGELNWKGLSEELYQYNTKVSVPFVVSSRGYGLLFDTYSYSRWGSPGELQQLGDLFTLYNKEGKQGCLTGTYTNAEGQRVVRDEQSIFYEDRDENLCLPRDFRMNTARIVFEGTIVPRQSYDYRFQLYYGGYVTVWVDGKEVVPERFSEVWNPCWWRFSCQLVEGVRTPIRIEWRPGQSEGYCGLRAFKPQSREQRSQLSFWSEMAQEIDYYFINGQTYDNVISGYRTLTGKAQVMPRWALGFWQSRQRYASSADIENTLARFRRQHIPIDNIVQDWHYYKEDEWGSHDFDLSCYPNPQAMLDSVHQMHGRLMISVWPKFYATLDNYRQMDERGWIYRQVVSDGVKDWVGPGYLGSFYDPYSADARKLFWKQIDERMYSKYKFGIDAWWMDASEPTVHDRTPMWYRKALSGPTALGTSTEYFNAYALLNAQAIYEGQRTVNPNQRVFDLTRSGFTGLQRYGAATWSGDISARWEAMRAQYTAALGYSMSGIPLWGMDIGGFYVEQRFKDAQQLFEKTGKVTDDLVEWRELMTRWTQFGCFSTIFRVHGEFPNREIWEVAPEGTPTWNTILWYDQLRYRLMPYLYSMAGWVYLHDYTMMRPLVMDFGTDKQTLDLKDQWMFGPSLMACPVGYYKARSREVYLPKQCAWYDLYTGKKVIDADEDGSQIVNRKSVNRTLVADAPCERMPVYVPAGSILPFGPAMEWSDEKPADDIVLYVYAGRNGSFQLYEDENTNYNYEKGEYSTIDFTYDDAARTLTIGAVKGGFKGMLKNRVFRVVLVTPEDGKALDFEPTNAIVVNYNGRAQTIKL